MNENKVDESKVDEIIKICQSVLDGNQQSLEPWLFEEIKDLALQIKSEKQ